MLLVYVGDLIIDLRACVCYFVAETRMADLTCPFYVKACWAFETEQPDELQFAEGEILTVTNFSEDENWWEVSLDFWQF